MSVKAAAVHIDWPKLSTSLGLKTETVAALSAFRKRNEEARRVLTDLKEQRTAVDFAHYRKVLKNQAIVDEVEKAFKGFKPTVYDVQAQIKSIEAVEAKAVRRFLSSIHLIVLVQGGRKWNVDITGATEQPTEENFGNTITGGSYINCNPSSKS